MEPPLAWGSDDVVHVMSYTLPARPPTVNDFGPSTLATTVILPDCPTKATGKTPLADEDACTR